MRGTARAVADFAYKQGLGDALAVDNVVDAYEEVCAERDRLRKAFDAIGALGGPLHMLEPDQGDGPPNYEWAATELRRILSTVNEGTDA